jgi:copper homeostasis protein
LGVHGIVSGALLPTGSLDLEVTQKLVDAAGPLHFTFHRAFDWVPQPLAAIKDLRDMGVGTVLTSGQQSMAEEGIPLLVELQTLAGDCTIMAGGGIHAGNAAMFKKNGLTTIHLSGTVFRPSQALAGKVPMNSAKHINEDKVAVTSVEGIRNVVETVK